MEKCNLKYYNDKNSKLIETAKADKQNIEEVTKEWEKLMREVKVIIQYI